ncbi:MAG: alpha/beta fold hydrolase [Allosphingosinicella sp.]
MARLLLLLLALLAAAPAAAHDPAPLAPGVHETVINGVRLWYRVAGREKATPVVFLHGGPGQGSQTFARFAGPAMERGNRMVYLDQRGSGRSEKHWKKEYSLDLMVDDLEQLRRHLGVEKMALVGHSFGTVLAMEYAAKYPGRVSHLVLAGAVVDFPAALDLQCARLERIDPEGYQEAVARRPEGRRCNVFAAGRAFVDNNMYPDPKIMKLVDDTDASDGMRNTGEISEALFGQGLLDYRFESAERLTMPVLAIAGGADYQAMVEPVRAFVATLPRGRLVEYEGRGHFMFVEESERFARDVTAFLQAPQ